MCGLLTIIAPSGVPLAHAERAESLLDRLSHRGPDGRGVRSGSRFWSGHRRLAIVDPHGSAQPFVHGGVTWVANGEIYDHRALRASLPGDIEAGDCAVIGPAWLEYGDRLPEMLDGPFAFTAVDERSGRWIAARDAYGICPLYLGRHADGSVWFASEMKALIDDCATVEIVPPGHVVTGDADGWSMRSWHRPEWLHDDFDPRERPDAARLRERLVEAVEKRLMCDVPAGVLLSGGLDSSLVASIASRLVGRAGLGGTGRLPTFSIGLAGSPDLVAARRVAGFLGTDHHEFVFTIEEALAAVPAVVRHLESFEQIRTAVPTYLLAQRIAEAGFKMVLSGEGADEIFGGYLYFHRAPDARAFHQETVRKLTRLHRFDVMRANKAPMAWGLELRFPFLDRDLVDLAMRLDPEAKMIAMDDLVDGEHPRMEKWFVRAAFDDRDDPWLPDDILWRQKEQFSDGVGYDWVDALGDHALARLHGDSFEARCARYGADAPATPEMLWMRELFEEYFVAGRAAGASALATVPRGRSVACSTPEALAWDPDWIDGAVDMSGRAMRGVHGANPAAIGAPCPLTGSASVPSP